MLKLVMSALQTEEEEKEKKSCVVLESPGAVAPGRCDSPISSFRNQETPSDESTADQSEASKSDLQLPEFENNEQNANSTGNPPSTLPPSRIHHENILSWQDQLQIEIENAQRAIEQTSLLNTLSLNSTDHGSFETCNPNERWLMQMQRANGLQRLDSQSYEDNPNWNLRSPVSSQGGHQKFDEDRVMSLSRSISMPREFIQSPRKWYRKSDEDQSPRANNPSVDDVELHVTSRTISDGTLSTVPSTTNHDREDTGEDEVEEDEKKDADENDSIDEDDIRECLSATESEVDPVDGLPSGLKKQYLDGGREAMLKTLDGIHAGIRPRSYRHRHSPITPPLERGIQTNPTRLVSRHKPETIEEDQDEYGPFFEPCVNLFWGKMEKKEKATPNDFAAWKAHHDVPLALLDCANLIHQEDRVPPPVPTSLVRVSDLNAPQSYADLLHSTAVDPRMQDWISNQYGNKGKPPKDGSYHLGKSRTVIVHEINRGNWTWCTAWSPSGNLLAVATENHHLAIVETSESTVWRVRHDRRVRGPMKKNSTHSIRSIAWGSSYIAIGGTGNAVSILESRDPYQIVHTIPETGFVGCLDWKDETDVLAIGSRLDFAMIVQIRTADEDSPSQGGEKVDSIVLRRIEYKYWVNCIKFSPDGSCLAVGDSGGTISVYDYEESGSGMEMNMITWFKQKDSMLSMEWSPDGKWLYAGGEDRSVTVIDTSYWEIVHRIGRDRWVQCISASRGGTHVAVGGVSSEISILDVENGWDSVMGIELKGLVPLSAKWHPKDQYLAITGQDTSILCVETTNARHVKGHHLHSISPILSIEFSPDGRMAIIGNQTGVVTFFSLSGTTFITAYELVIALNDKICTEWSLNGMFIVIGTSNSLMVVGRKRNKRQGKKCPPNASGFSVKKLIRSFGETHAVSIDFQSHYVAVSGDCTRILDVRADFEVIREFANGPHYANAWSPDGRWLAVMGKDKLLTIYDTSSKRVDHWRAIFAMQCDFVGLALAWGPLIVGGLLYLAYGGESKEIFIMEIRTHEGTWETVLRIPRDSKINALDWSTEGLLAAGIGNGTVGIMDLAYLQSGVAVNEMDYNWQRQALTCFTEIRRNRGHNSIQSLRWLPAAPGSDRLLAVGGTDGEVEIIDCTEKRRCRGYAKA